MTTELNLKLTTAGKDALWNSKNTGVNLELTHLQFGSRNRVTTGDESSLVQPKQAAKIENGNRIAPDQIRLMTTMVGDENYNVTEIGLWSGLPNIVGSVLVAYASVATGSIAQMVKGIDLVFAYDMVMSDAENVTIVKDVDQSSTFKLLAQHESSDNAHPFLLDKRTNNTVLGSNTFNGVTTFSGKLIGELTGNAASATKLKTARKINNVLFDGMNDINIQKSSVKINVNENLNNLIAQGSYHCDLDEVAATLKNAPTPFAFSLEVTISAGVTQYFTAYSGANTRQFIRSSYASEWTPWYKVYNELNPQPTVDAIDNLNSTDIKKPLSANQGRILSVGKFDKTGGVLTGEININTGEMSPIKTVINPPSAITNNSPTLLASIIHALSFGWYDSEWQIGNVRSSGQTSEGFGITDGNSDLRFLVTKNRVKNFGAFDSVGNITAPMVIGKLQGRMLTEQITSTTDKQFLDQYTNNDSSSFFFDGGVGKFFGSGTSGFVSGKKSGSYFALGATPNDGRIRAMVGVRDGDDNYRLQKNIVLLDGESAENNVSGDFVWDKNIDPTWKKGLIFKDTWASGNKSGFGASGTANKVNRIFMALDGSDPSINGNGSGVWIDKNGAYSNCDWYFTGKVNGALSGRFDGAIAVKDLRTVTPAEIPPRSMQVYFSEYTGLRNGVVTAATYGDFIALNGFDDKSGGKLNGLFFDKTGQGIHHFQAPIGSSSWGASRQIAYTDNQYFSGVNTFEDGIRVGNAGNGFKHLAKGIAGGDDVGWIGVGATADNTAYLELGTGDDGTEPIYVRQYSSGSPADGSARTKVQNEAVLLDPTGNSIFPKTVYSKRFEVQDREAILSNNTGRYIYVNELSWGCYSPTGSIPLGVGSGGTGNGIGQAPSATKLANARLINGVNFDGLNNINIPVYVTDFDGIVNANNFVKAGFYKCQSDVLAAASLNLPLPYAYSILVEEHAGVRQTYTSYHTDFPRTFLRNYYNGIWGKWYEIFTSANHPDKLQTARAINGVNFDGSANITIEDDTKFKANGAQQLLTTYPVWNAKSGVYTVSNGGGTTTVLQFLGGGSSSAMQFEVNYANNGLFYRSARDDKGFEVAFERIITERVGIAQSSRRLETPRSIGGVSFDGTASINLAGVNTVGNQNTSGNAATATKLQTARAINGVNFDGTADIYIPSLIAMDNRAVKPIDTPRGKFSVYFSSMGGMQGVGDADYGDFLTFNTYHDSSGGNISGLFFSKGSHGIYHYHAAQTSTTWGAPKRLAYNVDNVASATKLQTARAINGVNFDGLNNINIPVYVTDFDGIVNANNFVKAGFYKCQSDVLAAASLNLPLPYAYSILVEEHVGLRQTYTSYHTDFPRTFLRNYYNGIWGKWYEIFTSANRPDKLQTPRAINGVNFDGSANITIEDDSKFKANGAQQGLNTYPVWNSKSGVYTVANGGGTTTVLQFLGDGSAPAVQFEVSYANNGLFYRSARDGVGFERTFERIVTEKAGIAQSSRRLETPRSINGVNFDGTSGISITAAVRELGASSPNAAIDDGFYLFSPTPVNIAGLGNYGILEVRRNGNSTGAVMHQTYHASEKNNNGSMATRQSWDGGASFTPWRLIDPLGSWNLNQNGYIINPNGQIEQWGYINGGTDETTYNVTFPIAFPVGCLNIQVSRMRKYGVGGANDVDGGAFVIEGTISNTGFVMDHQRFNSNSVGSLGGTMWRAIGT